jgi:phosphatidate cytidylyltransferase
MTPQVRQRIGSAALFLPLVLAAVWLGPWTYAGLLAAIALAGGWELAGLLEGLGWRAPRFLPPLALGAFAGALFLGPVAVINALTALFWLASILWLFSPRVPSERKLGPWGWVLHVAGALLLGLFLACLGRLAGGPWPGAPRTGGDTHRVFYALIVVWACDTGAYACGSLFGRRRMWPAVSPQKTWEGAAGGAVAAVAAAALLARPLLGGLSVAVAGSFGLAAAAAAQIGDLFESRLKRKAGVKDSGKLLPGHGGVLDRFDSLLFTMPLAYLYFRLYVLPLGP